MLVAILEASSGVAAAASNYLENSSFLTKEIK